MDLERGWTLDHEDLDGAGIGLISGVNMDFQGHGTAVLGEVLMQDNARGGVGIVPACGGRVVSQWRTATNYSTSDAIISALINMSSGDALLLEAQTTVSGSSLRIADSRSRGGARSSLDKPRNRCSVRREYAPRTA